MGRISVLSVFMKSLIWLSTALKHNFKVFQLPWMRDHYTFFPIDLEKNLLIKMVMMMMMIIIKITII